MSNGHQMTPLTVEVVAARLAALERHVDALHTSTQQHITDLDVMRTELARQHTEAHIALHLAATEAAKAVSATAAEARTALQTEVSRQETRTDAAMDKRLEGVNADIDRLTGAVASFAPRDPTNERLNVLERWRSNTEGRITAYVGIILVAIPIISLLINWWTK